MGRPKTYSPMERKIARHLRTIANSKRWQERNQESVKAYRRRRWSNPANREKMMAQNREWYRHHPDHKSKMSRRAVRELRPFYVRNLLRLRGVFDPTPQQMEFERQSVLACRRKRAALKSRQVFGIIQACASLTKK